jgi:hypothetical protein
MNVDELIERTQWDFFWIPDDVAIVDRPEILYTHSTQDLKLFNQVTRTRATADRLPALVEEVVSAHQGRSSRWLVPATIPRAPLARELEAAGYQVAAEHRACALAVDEYRPRPAEGITVRPVDRMERLRDWINVAARAFGERHPGAHDDLERQLGECTMPGARVHRVVAYDDATGAPISSGGLTLFPALRFGLLWAGGTVPEARGRGAYSSVLKARARHAREQGLTHVGLYAVVDTSAPIVLRRGFTKHGPMTYWDRPA